jgi:hypothetical protein
MNLKIIERYTEEILFAFDVGKSAPPIGMNF